MDSWLDEWMSHKNVGPDLPLSFKIKEINGQLIIGKISKIVAIRCQILRLKCTKFDFFW